MANFPEGRGVREVFYCSPSMGRVRLVSNDCAGPGFDTLQKIEAALAAAACRGSSESEFHLRPSDHAAIVASLSVLSAPITEPVSTDRNGLVDPSIFSDEQIRAETYRRKLDGIHPMAVVLRAASAADLRAECERRFPQGFGVVHETTLRENAALTAERDSFKKALAEVDAVIHDFAPEGCHRADWLRERLTRIEPRQTFPQPKVGDIVAAIVERVAADDTEGACDVIDAQLFQERLADMLEMRGGRKLAADIRGVIVAACREVVPRAISVDSSKIDPELTRRMVESLPGRIEVVPLSYSFAPYEGGPGITAAPMRNPRHVAIVDQATEADLLCDDA